MNQVSEAERSARMALSCVIEAGDVNVGAMIEAEGAEAVWEALRTGRRDSRWVRRARAYDPRPVQLQAAAAQVRFIVPGDEEWPQQLDVLASAAPVQGLGGVPLGLWVRGSGDLARLTSQAVALVGARAASSYGEEAAAHLAVELTEQQWTTVSGGAYGIDAAAHRGALAAEGATVAVLAGGPNNPYPVGNSQLFRQILEGGVLVSEQPPGEHPTRVRFLARNRLIAALSSGVVVVEAAARSGARNTISWAGRCGRPAMAVPGSIYSGLSVTPHRLIRDQEAVLVTCAAEVREIVGQYGQDSLPQQRGPDRPLDDLDAAALAVYEAIPSRGGRSADELAVRTGLAITECLSALSTLEVGGYLSRNGNGEWRLTRVAG